MGAGLPFKCTAGLHHAVRHRAPDTGFEHHGFLNVLLAVSSALDGGAPEDVADRLSSRDPSAVVRQVAAMPAGSASRVRQAFRSFGSCSVLEPVEDLVALGLVPSPSATHRPD